MDSFLQFGLCEKALEFTVEVEFPTTCALPTKQYQFHSRHTVDKIKNAICLDVPALNKQDYALTIEDDQLSVDFVRFIVSNPKITQTLERGPIVKIQLAPKVNTFVSNREKIVLGDSKISDLRLTLEKSPIVERLAGGGRPLSPDTLSSSRMLKRSGNENKSTTDMLKEDHKESGDSASTSTTNNSAVGGSNGASTSGHSTPEREPVDHNKYATLSSLKHLALGTGPQHGSEDFNEFLDMLGQRIKLQGWSNYRGGLDVKSNTTGEESIYERFQDFEIMFHVATLLPYSIVDSQQVEKKRHIGNDIVVIIFKEGDRPFNPNVIQSDFNHVFIVVSVDKTVKHGPKRYNIAIINKDGVGESKPYLEYPNSIVGGEDFKNYLLCKCINAECSSYEAPSFKIKIQRTRIALLQDIMSTALHKDD
eukprot:gene11576-13509_t